VQLAEQNARIRAKAGDRIETQLNGNKVDDALVVRIYEVTDKALRLDLGESTENVSKRLVIVAISSFIPKLAGLVSKERAGELAAVLDEFEGELAALEAGGEPA